MTYFNPKVYNRENLKEKDKHELDFYFRMVMNAIYNAEFDSKVTYELSPTLKKIKGELIEEFAKEVKEQIAITWDEIVVTMIDEYEEDVEEREEYTQYEDKLDD